MVVFGMIFTFKNILLFKIEKKHKNSHLVINLIRYFN